MSLLAKIDACLDDERTWEGEELVALIEEIRPSAVLLADMADAVALARGYVATSDQFGALDINALLARLADLETRT